MQVLNMPERENEFNLSNPPKTIEERVALFKRFREPYVSVFDEEAKHRQDLVENGTIEDEPTEEIWFGKVTLELNPYPSLYLVDYYLQPIMGPRLELHLRGRIGIHAARQQMGRIARYIDARNLSEEFQHISAITYPQLALAAQAITGMSPAIYTHTPAVISRDAYSRLDGAFESQNKFLKKHGRPKITPEEFSIQSQTLPTAVFAEHWRDHIL